METNGAYAFLCIAFLLTVTADMVSYLRTNRAVYVLHCKTAIPDHLAGFLQAYSPQAKAEYTVTLNVLFYSAADALFIKGIWVVLHDVGIGKNRV